MNSHDIRIEHFFVITYTEFSTSFQLGNIMLKFYLYGAIVLGAALSTNALAIDCLDSNKRDNTALGHALLGNTVCVGSSGNWEAQEEHRPGDELSDYHSGPDSANLPTPPPIINDPDSRDPTDRLGTWTITDNEVTYNYTNVHSSVHDSGPYTYTLHNDGSLTLYKFCAAGSGTDTEATILTGTGAGCTPP